MITIPESVSGAGAAEGCPFSAFIVGDNTFGRWGWQRLARRRGLTRGITLETMGDGSNPYHRLCRKGFSGFGIGGGERKSKKSLCPRFGFGHARKIYGAGDAVVKAGWICGEP